MKRDEDLGHDRGDEFQTDDEENQAERVGESENDSDSDVSVSSPNSSHNRMDSNTETTWPKSYWQSMEMLTIPSISFQRVTSSFLTSAHKRHQISGQDSSLSNPLISETSLDREEVPTSTLPVKLSETSYSILSLNESALVPQRQCTFAQAVLNGINALCGIGLLTTPYAVREGGWWSLSLLIILGVIAYCTGILLKECLESSPRLRTYPDIAQAAFGKTGRFGIVIFLYVELYGTCVEYVILMSDNLASMFPNTYMRFAGVHLDSHQTYAIVVTLFILPTVWLRDISFLSYISVGGIATSILVVLCLLWVGVVDEVGFHQSGAALDLANLSVSVGIYSFCYSGHSVFPNIYSTMNEPSQFPWVLLTCFGFCVFIYTGVGVCGILMFGDSIKSQFTLNMPKDFVASKVAVWASVVNPISKFAITISPVALGLEELLPSTDHPRSYRGPLFVRTILVLSTLAVALKVPFFGSMMALIGSFLAIITVLIFPCACYLRLLSGRVNKLQIAACTFTIIVGIVCSCAGTYSAISRIAGQTD